MRLRSPICLALTALVGSGCFAYVPINASGVAAGRDIRVELTDAGTADLAAMIGPGTVAIDGRLAASDTSVLRLLVSQTTDRRGLERPWRGEPVLVPRAYVARLAQRKFSATHTGLVAGGILAGALLGGVVVHNAGGSSSGTGHHGGS